MNREQCQLEGTLNRDEGYFCITLLMGKFKADIIIHHGGLKTWRFQLSVSFPSEQVSADIIFHAALN